MADKSKFHVTPTGQARACSAQTAESCKYSKETGEVQPHFETREEAKAYAEKKLSAEHGETTQITKNGSVSERPELVKKDVFDITVPGMTFDAQNDSPADFDKVYAEVSNRLADADFRRGRAYTMIQHRFNKKRYNPETRKTEFIENGGKVLADVRQNIKLNPTERDLVETWEKAERESTENVILKTKIERAFNKRGGWNRAYLVPDGHLHKDMNCSTCNKGETPTKFQFMTDYSGKKENEIVGAAGYRACTTCYPTAPVGDERSLPSQMLTDDERKRNEEREAQKAKLAQKKVDAVTKAPTASGDSLRIRTVGGSYEDFKTERAASIWYVGEVGQSYYDEGLNAEMKKMRYKVAYNLALKHDKPISEIQDEMQVKVVAKAKRDHKEQIKYHKEMPTMYSAPPEKPEIPQPDRYDVPDELLNVSPREWEDADFYIPED